MGLVRPSREGILARREAAAAQFAGLHEHMEREDRYFRGEWVSDVRNVPKDMEGLLPPLPSALISDAVDNVVASGPQVTVLAPPVRDARRRAAQERVERVQRAVNAFWQQAERRAGLSPLRDLTTNVFLRGAGFLFFAPDLRFGAERPVRAAGESKAAHRERVRRWEGEQHNAFPFVLRSVDPLNMLWDLDGAEPAWVIEEFERDAEAVAERYPHWRRPDRDRRGGRLGQQTPVRWTAYWSADWYALYADGEPVLTREDGADADGVAPNPLGFVPYFGAYSGLGKESWRGRPEDTVVGLLRRVLPMFNAQARCLSQLDGIRALMAWPALVLEGPAEEAAAAADAWAYGPATLNIVPEGVKVRWAEVPSAAGAVFQELGVLGDLIEQATYSRVVSGAGLVGDPAAKHAQLLAQARLKFTQPMHGIAQAMERVVERYLFSVERLLKRPVTLWGMTATGGEYLTLRPEDIAGYYENRVTLMPASATERAQRLALGSALGDAISRRTFAQEYGGVPNPQEEAFERLVEQVLEQMTPNMATLVAQDLEASVRAERGLGAEGSV
ncbi:MAG: hypothetical protein NTZ05_16325 [Chloroflexi bacterium]|nr:hypothetical protein [Chloroflexota bacterium]